MVLSARGIEEELAILSFEAPPHERDLPLASAVESYDRLHRSRCNVVFRPEVEFFRFGTRRKQFCDPLFVGMSFGIGHTYIKDNLAKLLALILHDLASAPAHLSVHDTLTAHP